MRRRAPVRAHSPVPGPVAGILDPKTDHAREMFIESSPPMGVRRLGETSCRVRSAETPLLPARGDRPDVGIPQRDCATCSIAGAPRTSSHAPLNTHTAESSPRSAGKSTLRPSRNRTFGMNAGSPSALIQSEATRAVLPPQIATDSRHLPRCARDEAVCRVPAQPLPAPFGCGLCCSRRSAATAGDRRGPMTAPTFAATRSHRGIACTAP
jgi:hypothetical protein